MMLFDDLLQLEYQKKRAEEIFEITMTENFQQLMKYLGISDITKQDKYKKKKKTLPMQSYIQTGEIKDKHSGKRQKKKKTLSMQYREGKTVFSLPILSSLFEALWMKPTKDEKERNKFIDMYVTHAHGNTQ